MSGKQDSTCASSAAMSSPQMMIVAKPRPLQDCINRKWTNVIQSKVYMGSNTHYYITYYIALGRAQVQAQDQPQDQPPVTTTDRETVQVL